MLRWLPGPLNIENMASRVSRPSEVRGNMPHCPSLFVAPALSPALLGNVRECPMKKTNFGGLTKPSKSPYRTKRKYYAVRHGRNGFTGVLSSWDECEPLIKGVKGVSYKSFPSEEEAFAFARPEAAQQQPSSASGRQAKKKFYAIRQGQGGFRGVVSSWDECQLYVQGTPGVRYKSFKTYEEAFEFSQTVEEPNADPGSSVADAGGASHPTDSDPEFILRIDMAPVPFFPSPQQYSKLIVFTDGACQNNGKWNSRAGYGVFFGENSPYNISEPLRGHATNQRAEMTAVLAAIQTVLANDLVTRHGMLEVRTDSQVSSTLKVEGTFLAFGVR